MIYFSGDQHFGHNNILNFCKETRKFNSIEEHDQAVIAAHNRIVGPDDEWWCLGDFSFSDAAYTRKMFYALNGRVKNLIIGNHDKQSAKHLPWDTITQYHELNHNKTRFVLFHYPIKEGQWNGAYHGSVLIFGHVHGRPQYTTPVRALDVGLDNIGMSPISIEDVHKRMIKIPKYSNPRIINENQ